MSIRVMTQVWEHSAHKGSDLILLLAIADFADDHGYAHPGIQTLARKCRMSARNIRYVIERLLKSGELAIKQNTGRGGTNEYWITLSKNLNLFQEKGEKIAPLQSLHPCNPASERVQSSVEKGATAIAPEPLNQKQPSGKARARTPRPGVNYDPPEEVRAWARHLGYEPYLPLHIEKFRNACAVQRRGAYEDLDAAFRNCVMDDWGHVRRQAKDAERRGERPAGLRPPAAAVSRLQAALLGPDNKVQRALGDQVLGEPEAAARAVLRDYGRMIAHHDTRYIEITAGRDRRVFSVEELKGVHA